MGRIKSAGSQLMRWSVTEASGEQGQDSRDQDSRGDGGGVDMV